MNLPNHMLNVAEQAFQTPFAIGFEPLLERLIASGLNTNAATSMTGYPPFNTVKISDTQFLVEIALAGFSREEISVSQKDQTLTVQILEKNDNDPEGEYLHKGISARTFVRKFELGDAVSVSEVKFVDGMLKIHLEVEVPEVNETEFKIG